MLEHKGIAYKRTDLLPVISKGALRAVGFPASDGAGAEDRRRTRCRARARSPASWSGCGPSRRSSPPTPRSAPRSKRPSASATRSCSTRSARSSGGRSSTTRRRCAATPRAPRSGMPIGLAMKTAAPIVALSARFNEASDENARAGLAALPALLDRVDELIAAGTINGEELERRRLPDRPQHRPGDDARRPAPGDRGPAGRRAGQARRPRLPRQDAADPPRRLARAAARPAGDRPPRASPDALDPLPGGQGGEGVGEAGAVGQGQVRVELQQRGEDEAAAA